MNISKQNQKGWIAWFVYNPVAANLLMITLLVVGFFTLSNLRTEGFPESDPNIVTITVNFEGGTPEIVEEGAAIKIEDALNGMEGVYQLKSTITSGGVTVAVRGNDGYSVSRLKDDVKTRVDAITSFPAEVDNIVITQAQEERHVLYVQIYGDAEHDVLKKISKQVRKRLLKLETVNKVTINGSKDFEINIAVQEDKLRKYDLSFAEVADAVRASSLNLSAGEMKTTSGTIMLQARQQNYHGHEYQNIIIRSSEDGGVVRLSDLAIINDGYTEQKLLSRFLDLPSINLDIELVGRDSVMDASNDVRSLMAGLETESWIPDNIKFAIWSDEADNVKDSLGLLSQNALMGVCLVLILLALFLHPKIAFWVAVGIPVSFAGAFFVMGPALLDYSLNDLTTFAFIIVLGIVVDDAIIIGESIYTYKKRNDQGVETAIEGAKAVATPATFGVLTTVAAFYPLTTFTSNFGGSFRMIAVVVIVCLLFSLVESKWILPAHLARLNVKEDKKTSNKFMMRLNKVRSAIEHGLEQFIQHQYRPMIEKAVAYRYQSLGIFIAIFILAAGLVTSGVVRTVFFGDDEGNLLYAQVTMHLGTPAEKTHKIAQHLEQSVMKASAILKEKYNLKDEPVLYTYAHASTDEVAAVTVEIKPGSQRPFYSQELLDVWREVTGPIATAKELSFYVDWEGSESLQVELSSFDGKTLESAIADLKQKVSTYQGVYDIRTNQDNYISELSITLKPEAERLGLSNLEVMTQLRNAIFGVEVQRIQRNDEEIRVKVRYPEMERNNISDLNQIRIRTQAGGTVPLFQVANIQQQKMQSEITRIDGERVLVLSAEIDEDLVSPSVISNMIEAKIFPEIARAYPAVALKISGEGEAEGEATTQLGSGFVLGLLIIYALLAIPLKSYIEPLIIMLAIPFGIIGAILGHLIIGIPISLLSFFGILALSGVVVNDALVFVNRYNQLRHIGKTYEEAVVDAGVSRFRAVFLTSITTFVGLAPLLQERSEQAQTLIPMAVSLAFGILFATVITLFIVPVLLGIRSDMNRFLCKLFNKNTALET